MSKSLVHVHRGPESPTKAALGFLVAATTARGMSYLFLASDGDGAA